MRPTVPIPPLTLAHIQYERALRRLFRQAVPVALQLLVCVSDVAGPSAT